MGNCSESQPQRHIQDFDKNFEMHDLLALLDTALANAPMGFVLVDLDCRYIKVNSAMTIPTGRDPSIYIGKTVREMVPQIADFVEEIVRRIAETLKPVLYYEIKVGNYCQVLNSYPVRTSDGKLGGVCSFVTDITEFKKLKNEATVQRERLADFIDQMPGLVWEGRKLSENGPLQVAILNTFPICRLGYAEELLSDPNFWTQMIHPEDIDIFLGFDLSRGTGTSRKEIEYRCLSSDGREIYMEGNLAAIFDHHGNQTGIRGVAVDVSERKVAEAEKKRLSDEVSRSLSLRNEFIAVASHELKNPLAALKMQAQVFSQLIAPGESIQNHGKKIEKLVSCFVQEIDGLIRLTNDMLEARKIEEGCLVMQMEKVDLLKLVRETIENFEKDLTLVGYTFHFDSQASYFLNGDPLRLSQVVINLLTNALKYGAKRPISIRLEKRSDQIVMEVVDHGIGIATDDLHKIFDCYERVGKKQHYSGLGLGLYIVRKIVQAHGGQIDVSSSLGKGSSFQIVLPSVSQIDR